jgi:hypothetical protein
MIIKIEITNNTNFVLRKKDSFFYNVGWSFPDELSPQETTEGIIEIEESQENFKALVRYTEEIKSFQLWINSLYGNNLMIDTEFLDCNPSGTIPIIDQTVISFVLSEVSEEIQNKTITKKGEPCSSKKDAKKAKESKSKGKRLT